MKVSWPCSRVQQFISFKKWRQNQTICWTLVYWWWTRRQSGLLFVVYFDIHFPTRPSIMPLTVDWKKCEKQHSLLAGERQLGVRTLVTHFSLVTVILPRQSRTSIEGGIGSFCTVLGLVPCSNGIMSMWRLSEKVNSPPLGFQTWLYYLWGRYRLAEDRYTPCTGRSLKAPSKLNDSSSIAIMPWNSSLQHETSQPVGCPCSNR